MKLDPWGAVYVDDYSKLFSEFGISSFDEILSQMESPHRYMKRRIIFGHRNYDSVLKAMQQGRPFGVMSGFMPSGRAHFGHMMVMNEIIWHQQQGADAFAAIANMEAHAVRGISWERCRESWNKRVHPQPDCPGIRAKRPHLLPVGELQDERPGL